MRASVIAAVLGASAWCGSIPAAAADCSSLRFEWISERCERAADAFRSGRDEIYLSGYTYHHRGTYSQESLDQFNERSWGLGYGRYVTDANGDEHSVFAFVIRDSHSAWQKMIGYGYHRYWSIAGELRVGLGFGAFLVSRPDIFNSIPFPAVLPLLSLRYRNASLIVTGIPKVDPNVTGAGNVLFVFGRITL